MIRKTLLIATAVFAMSATAGGSAQAVTVVDSAESTAVERAGTRLTATPAKGLKNKQTITLKGTGFLKNSTIFVIQCKTTVQSSCDMKKVRQAKSNAKGAFTLKYQVTTGTVCKAKSTCYLGAGDPAGAKIASAKLKFA